MPTPTQRHNSSRIGRANAHQHLKKKSLVNCAQCKKPVMPHEACGFCGMYKGRTVLKVKTKARATAKK